jgi:voltage-gated potassium channel
VIVATVLAPLTIALELESKGLLLIFDILVTFVFVIDLVVIFHTGIVERRKVVLDPHSIRRAYLKGWFAFDLLAAFPFFMFTGVQFLALNRIVRFARMIRIIKLFSGARSLTRVKKSQFNPNVLRLVLMIFWLLMASHVIACGFIMVEGVSPDLPPATRYLQSFYWTITTVATVGYGDITPDRTNTLQLIYVIITQLVGVGMYGFVIGNISTVIANIDIAKTQYREKMEKINTFLKYRNMPENLTKRINDYYDYLWESRRGYDESSVVDELPFSLRIQVATELHREIIAKVPMFAGASSAFIRDIILNMVSVVFTPGDYVVRKGEIGEEMFFISRGSVDVVSEDESIVFATLQEGAFFGEIALLLSTPRTATIKAKDYCDLYSLNKSTFERILSRYPDFAKNVKELAEQRRKETEEAAKKATKS